MQRVRLFCVALAATLIASSGTSYASEADDQYTTLARQYFDLSFRANPVSATQAGVHEYDDKLGDFSAAATQAQNARDHRYLHQLDEINRSQLSPEVQLDATLFQNMLLDNLLLNEKLAQWKHDPDQYTQAASGAVFSIMSRDYAPLPKRLSYAIARERAIPTMLAEAKANITSVDAVTQRISVEDATGAVDFFKTSVPQAFASVKDAALQAQFASANAAVLRAMTSYAAWIKHLTPHGSFAIGADAYQKRLQYEDALDIPLDQYLAIGQRALDATREEFIATAKSIDPKKAPLQVYLDLAKVHPTASALLPKAQSDLTKLRAFLIAKNIVTLAPDANIKVIETPPFERATTEAAEDSPGPLEDVATQAYYYVTPVNPAWTKAQQEDFLAEFNDFEFPIISAHEVYPGHFTNFSLNRHLDLSETRKLLTSSEFAEGWAHYSEQMMVEQGWGDNDPRVHLAQL